MEQPALAGELSGLIEETRDALAAAEAEDWAPITNALAELDAAKSPEDYAAALRRLRDNLPSIIEEVYSSGKTAAALGKALTDAAALGTASITDLKNSACRAKDPANCKIHGTGKYKPEGEAPVNPAAATPPQPPAPKIDTKETTDPAELGDFYNRALSDRNYKGVRVLDTIAPSQAAAIKEAHGLNVEGRKYILTADRLHHIHKKHGDPKTESPRGQVAISQEDIKNLPAILAKGVPTKTTPEVGRNGAPKVLLESQMGKGKGRYQYVLEVLPKKGQLEIATLYKFKNRAGRDAFLRPLTLTSEATARVSRHPA